MGEAEQGELMSTTDELSNATRWLSARAKAFKPSLIGQISQLAERCKAINLSEGFPDYPAPAFLKEAGKAAIGRDFNQYRYVQKLCKVVGRKFSETTGLNIDPATHVSICCGQSGAFSSAILAVIGPGDEVLILDPAYETYGACVMLAGGSPKYVPLPPPDWRVTRSQLDAAVGPNTKAIVVNSPANPTGRVLSLEELTAIAEVCCQHDLLAITDEVYEYLLYGANQHTSLASLPGMLSRTIVTSSISKTFCVTGWRVGWAISPPELRAAIDKVHCKLADSPPAPFQEAALVALSSPPEYYQQLREDYEEKRGTVCELLEKAGFEIPCQPDGGMFVFARIPSSFSGSDVDFVKELITVAGIAVVPGSNFFHTDADAYRLHHQSVDGESQNGGRSCPPKACPGGIDPAEQTSPRRPDLGPVGNGSSEVGGASGREEGSQKLPSGKACPGVSAHLRENMLASRVGQQSEPHLMHQSNGCASIHNIDSFAYTKRYVRVAFCKSKDTLQAAALAMARLQNVQTE